MVGGGGDGEREREKEGRGGGGRQREREGGGGGGGRRREKRRERKQIANTLQRVFAKHLASRPLSHTLGFSASLETTEKTDALLGMGTGSGFGAGHSNCCVLI